MATFRFELNGRPTKNKTYVIYLRVTGGGKRKLIKTMVEIARPSDFNAKSIKNILGHSNLATTERYMGSFDTSKTDETLRNVFAKKQSSSKGTEEPTTSKEEQAIELLKGMTPEQIMAVISAINKQYIYSPLNNSAILLL